MPVRKSRKANGKANGHALGTANGAIVYPFRVGRSRTGLGIFATAPIKKGKFIVEYVGPLLSNEECETIENKYLFEVNARWTIDGSSRQNVARYINHSCRPNCEVEIWRGRIYVMAKRAIKSGEELFYDYGTEYFDAHIRPKGCVCSKCLPLKNRR